MASGTDSINLNLVPPYVRELQTYKAGKSEKDLQREINISKISKLASNENPMGPSPKAIEAIKNGIDQLHRYPDPAGFDLKSALAKLYGLKMENIILGNGSEGIMAYIARAFLAPDREVLTSESTFIGFYIIARSVGSKLKMVPLTPEKKYDVDALASAISAKTKVIYLANPNNPTGTYITKKEFDYLMQYVPDHVLVILDEAYFEYAKDKEDFPDSMDYRYDNVITLRTFSKAYGLAGLRVGYGFAHHDLISNLSKVKLVFEPNMLAQIGATACLQDFDHLKKTLKNNQIQFSRLEKYFKKKNIETIPTITNFMVFKLKDQSIAHKVYLDLMNEGVIIRPLETNGMPSYLRISIGTEAEMNHFFGAFDKISF